IIYRNTLLEAENKTLREENNLLSRRRRSKKTRLRQGGSLTIAEADDLQSQKEAIAQIKEETRRSNGRRPRTETGQRRCGVCGNTGHNARTCPFQKEICGVVAVERSACLSDPLAYHAR
ncbi:hypothetical protein BDP81DRAFT_424998, partial [Colletotrichum phormii]